MCDLQPRSRHRAATRKDAQAKKSREGVLLELPGVLAWDMVGQ